MKVKGKLKKQPGWKMQKRDGKYHTGDSRVWHWQMDAKITECDVPIIEATFEFTNFCTGYSTTRFYLTDVEDGCEYMIHASALFEGVNQIVDGRLTGLFTFRKQGRVITLWPYKEGE